ncbi:hypothetical protein ACFYNO_32805 [Kitasatospora sp. NPDC006697]|uniref:hypothetical protein n=1 Tax=Kitasatospora sp. NPDC006697 TaxID=3364020 RepID=UPI00368EFFE4
MRDATSELFPTGRRKCTGESHQALRSLQREGVDASGIPAADSPEQEALEAAVFYRVCKMGGLSAHPLGIMKVSPEPERLTVRLLDEPYVVRHWAERLLPQQADELTGDRDPRDCIHGVPGLRSRVGAGGVALYRPGTSAQVLLTGFNTRWWERITALLNGSRPQLFTNTAWAPLERAAHVAGHKSELEESLIGSAILRRIRATAGPGEINSTDAWSCGAEGLRLETTDGPPCPELIRSLCERPWGLGWRVEHAWCTCRQPVPEGCTIDFRLPTGQQRVYYSNLHWGRTSDERRQATVRELNQSAFAV